MNCSYDMHDTYDIFKKLPDEGTVWVGAVKGENRVRQVLVNLKSSSKQAFFFRIECERRNRCRAFG